MLPVALHKILTFFRYAEGNSDICDTIIECKDGETHLPGLLLAASSNFWRDVLSCSSNIDSKIHILFPDVEIFDLQLIFSLLYEGIMKCSNEKKDIIRSTVKQFLPDIEVIEAISEDKESKTLTNIVDIDLTCKFCFKYFSSKEACAMHMKTLHHNKDTYFKCSVCTGKFRSQKALDNHIKQKHTDKEPQVYSCPTCQASFIHMSSLRRHVKTANHQYPPIDTSVQKKSDEEYCGICGKSVGRLEFHMNKHHGTDVNDYECVECGKKFKRKDKLNQHEELVHRRYNINFSAAAQYLNTNPDEWRCKMCHETFDSVRKLERHLTLQNCVKHTCKYCEKQFKEKHNLTKHINNSHVAKELYKCDNCEKKYQLKSSLTRHKKICHKPKRIDL